MLDSSGTILDTIMIDTSTVLAADNTKSSLTRVESERHVTTASGSIGMVDGYYGSPMYW
ncbi:MAG: hypothetical protein H6766_05950 [Candidatus Peribacteria bacterium]|nr:MAG: hypothetical protein H6766_05950 [Candidatus Peribacteria bacterium]